MKITILWAAFLLVVSPAWAISKCTGVDSKVVFQDAPCQGKGEVLEVKPASGKRDIPAPGVSTATGGAYTPTPESLPHQPVPAPQTPQKSG